MRPINELLVALGVTITMALPITAHLEDCPKDDCAWGAWAVLLGLTATGLLIGLALESLGPSDAGKGG